MPTPRGAPELASAQATPETTVNEQIRHTEAGACFFPIVDKDLTAPPGSCADGASYIIGGSPTGLWSGKADQIATAVGTNAGSGWLYHAELEGLFAYIQDENALYWNNGSAWAAYTGGAATEASNSEIWDGTETNKFVSPRRLFTANESVSVTYGATITLDGDTGFNFHTTLTGNTDFANPSNMKAGQTGRIRITQDGTGSRTATWGTNWKFVGGDPTLSTAASAVDIVAYYCHSSSIIEATFGAALA